MQALSLLCVLAGSFAFLSWWLLLAFEGRCLIKLFKTYDLAGMVVLPLSRRT